MESRLLTPEEAARILNVTPRRVRDLIKARELPGMRLGHTYRVDRVALEQFFAKSAANLKT